MLKFSAPILRKRCQNKSACLLGFSTKIAICGFDAKVPKFFQKPCFTGVFERYPYKEEYKSNNIYIND